MENGEVDWGRVAAGAIIGGVAGVTLGAGTALITTGSALASTGSVLAALGIGTGVGIGGASATGAASSWANYNANNLTSNSAQIGKRFADWFCSFNNIADSAREVVVKGIGLLDAIIQNANARCSLPITFSKPYQGWVPPFAKNKFHTPPKKGGLRLPLFANTGCIQLSSSGTTRLEASITSRFSTAPLTIAL